MRIGVFDSGIGGLTVLKEAIRLMPNEDYLYYADTKHVPYGTKPKDEVRGYIFDAVDFFASQGVGALVVACNTATSIAINDLRERYSFPIIGMEPAVKTAVEKADDRRVLVLATPITVREKKLHDLVERLDSEQTVDLHALPGLVGFAEKFIFDEDTVTSYLLDEFSRYDLRAYGAVVLGCTHFIFFRKFFKMILPQGVDIIDGNLGTINRLKTLLENRGLSHGSKGNIKFYCSGEKEIDDSKYRKYLELEY
ncbi:MAG: glutamate racemase [Clostridiaceae bacterium]|nr:glutamate racemase [Clostridiaceae bacterium]